MARVIPPGFGEAKIIQKALGDPEPYICTLGVDLSGFTSTFDNAAGRIMNAWRRTVLIGQSTSLTLVGCDLAVGQDGGDPVVYTAVSGATGEVGANMLPQNCALLVQKRTELAGRSNRGRMYVPMILVESGVDNYGTIDADDRVDYQTQFTNFYLDLTEPDPPDLWGPIQPVILHSGSASAQPPTPISRFSVEPVIATQRRRLR